MANKMQVWPGPRIMVPMPTDVLLVGEPDLPQPGDSGTGTPLSSTKTNYFDLFLADNGGMIQEDPFNVVSRDAHLEVGAHMMWTLPYSLRKGKQENNEAGQAVTEFPNAPNCWLITRFEYKSIEDGTAPVVTAQIVRSNELQEGVYPSDPLISDYPLQTGNLPVSKIGSVVPIAEWDGNLLAADQKVDVKAVGPGTVSWSVTYDNVRNVFGFHDAALSNKATKANPYYYTYLVVGWYDEAELDAMYNIDDGLFDPCDTDPGTTWLNLLKSQFGWSLGTSDSALQDALDAWAAWQTSHGIEDGVFDPNKVDLPPQAKANIIAWHDWQQANGSTATEPIYAKQLLCHSLVSNVKWNGDSEAYTTGNPMQPGEYPDLAAGNNAVEAISTFMANKVVNDPDQPQSPSQIPIIARALEAFQKDLLYDYQTDPVGVENLLHEATFSKSTAGQEWVVVRNESTENDKLPSTDAGKQSIPLNATDTQALIDLNTEQAKLNALNNTISTARNELYLLYFKQTMIKLNENNSPVPSEIVTKVDQSYLALSSNLNDNIALQSSLAQSIETDSAALQACIKDNYILKAVDLSSFCLPNDPVIMVAGAKVDTKFSKTVADLSSQLLDVRYSGQSVDSIEVKSPDGKSLVIEAEALLNEIQFPVWNAVPKEVMELWVESLLLDKSAASLLAQIFVTATSDTTSLADLTDTIKEQQNTIWSGLDDSEFPREATLNAAGFTGVAPAEAAIAFRSGQPWTPVFMDWSVKWIPTSLNSSAPFIDWELEEIDYEWSGKSIPDENVVELTGRSILSPGIAQNIQSKLSAFKNDPNYDNLPELVKDDLTYIAGQIGNYDILTQSVTGFTQNLITKLTAGSLSPTADGEGQALTYSLLDGANQSYVPELGPTDCSGAEQQYAPIRSGHFQIRNVWVIDAFGQIMYAAPNKGDAPPKLRPPLTNIKWSESLTTPEPSLTDAYGELAPRLSQAAKIELQLLQQDNDAIDSNSADATSPICGWVMANHLDNSLMVFDKDGTNLGAVIKVQSETTTNNWSIRWDSAPGLNTTLGAPPKIDNQHLAAFITGLLDTRFEGAEAYEDLMATIDSTLWTFNNQGIQKDNLTLLVGKPLAVVRAEVSLNISGQPIYQQGWCETGKYYNNDGEYQATAPPYLSTPFSLRVGDAYVNDNGVLGYFQADNYDQFYAVYGVNGETTSVMQSLRSGANLQAATIQNGEYASSYVEANHLVKIPANGQAVKLTVVMDPNGVLPVFPGSLPFQSKTLPNGPVTEAMNNMKASFRVGPVLIDPASIRMPLPSEVKGQWSWRKRADVSSWTADADLQSYTAKATLDTKPLRLTEGWLILEKDTKEN